MANDIELLKQLQKAIGKKLKQLQKADITKSITNGYALNERRQVTGLNLDNIKLDAEALKCLSQFSHLKRLSVYGTGLKTLSPLQSLTKLTRLDCSGIKVSDLSPLRGLTNLIRLDFGSTQVSDLSPLQGLTNLTQLDLRRTQVSDLSPLQGLTNLTRLDARNNSISRLPEALLQLDMEIDVDEDDYAIKDLLLLGNPLESPPPEIIRKGKDAIRNYFRSLEMGPTRPLNEVKVILVGDGGAGKTSLVNHIIHRKFDPREDPTQGIDIRKWQPENTLHDEDIQVRVWDFGGQEILHATHQFFLSKRSLYILVLDGRKDEKTEYWLKQIQSFGHNSPVLVVLNKIDHNPRFDVNRQFLQTKYPNIIGFHRISCKNGKNIDHFIETLTNNLDKVELLGSTWSVKWFRVKERLEAMKEHYIDYQRYREFCKAEGIRDEETRATLVEFLNDLGVVLHFRDRNLAHTHVLDPEWVTNAVYKIINSSDNGAVDGVLPLSQLDLILAKCKKTPTATPRRPTASSSD
ncbi:MAG: GTP-binding protein [bacterium]|nr:GTP-binding protein [bacterium]